MPERPGTSVDAGASPAAGAAVGRPREETLTRGLPTLGALALALLGVCLFSGVVVMTAYEPARPFASLVAFELARPYGWLFRALHRWSADLFVLVLVAHTVEHVARRSHRAYATADARGRTLSTWTGLVIALPVTAYAAIGGYALLGDAEASGVAAVMRGLVEPLPFAGPLLADVFVGPAGAADTHVLLAHHVGTATLVLAGITVLHVDRLRASLGAYAAALALAGALALTRRPALGPEVTADPLRGPWFMGGLRVLLESAPVWLVGQVLPFAAMAVLAALPVLPVRWDRSVRIGLGVALAAYAVLTAWAVRV